MPKGVYARPTLKQRLQKHSQRQGRCRVWVGAVDKDGYGKIQFQGKNHMAHRVAFFHYHGRWPVAQVLHRCDNPPCIAKAHLFEGTDTDNKADKMQKNRQARGEQITKNRRNPSRERNGRAKLTEVEVAQIREMYATCDITQREIGNYFGVHNTVVSKIVNNQLWNIEEDDSQPEEEED